MPRQALITSLLLLVPALAACSDPSRPSSALVDAELGGVVESTDGKLRLEIPPGALAHDTEITVTLVPRDEWPDDVAGFAPAADVYEMQPEGLRFSTPARLVQVLEHEHHSSFPALFGLSRSADGTMSMMGSPTVHYELETSTATFTADLHHFSETVVTPLTTWKWNDEAGRFQPDLEAEGLYLGLQSVDYLQWVGFGWGIDVNVLNLGQPLTEARGSAWSGSPVAMLDYRLSIPDVITERELGLGSMGWECKSLGWGSTTHAFFARRRLIDTLVGVIVTDDYKCIEEPEWATTAATTAEPGDDPGDGAETADPTLTTTSGETSEGGETSGETSTTTRGETSGETTDDGTGGETTGGETTGGTEPWQGCLEQPADLCEPCCERMSEDGEQFEQCTLGCG
jgi:hypothetical protein